MNQTFETLQQQLEAINGQVYGNYRQLNEAFRSNFDDYNACHYEIVYESFYCDSVSELYNVLETWIGANGLFALTIAHEVLIVEVNLSAFCDKLLDFSAFFSYNRDNIEFFVNGSNFIGKIIFIEMTEGLQFEVVVPTLPGRNYLTGMSSKLGRIKSNLRKNINIQRIGGVSHGMKLVFLSTIEDLLRAEDWVSANQLRRTFAIVNEALTLVGLSMNEEFDEDQEVFSLGTFLQCCYVVFKFPIPKIHLLGWMDFLEQTIHPETETGGGLRYGWKRMHRWWMAGYHFGRGDDHWLNSLPNFELFDLLRYTFLTIIRKSETNYGYTFFEDASGQVYLEVGVEVRNT